MSQSWSGRIKKLIDRKGSMEQLAADLGVSFYTVERWMRGDHKPSRLAQQQIEKLEKEQR